MKIEGIEVLCGLDFEEALKAKAKRMMKDLKMSDKAIARYSETVKQDMKFVKLGKKPEAVVAGRVYWLSLVCSEPRSQVEIYQKTGICPTSMRGHYNQMKKRRDLNVRLD